MVLCLWLLKYYQRENLWHGANEAKNNYAINEDIEINKPEEEIVISQNNIIQLEENNL